MKKLVLSVMFLALCMVLSGQEEIFFYNPSFEDMPRPGKAPDGWYDCGFPGETPPDVQPDPTFSVSKPPYNGETYLGMVVRDNGTWEGISQKLEIPLDPDRCYNVSFFLARSELYISSSRTTKSTANYTTPAVLRIWGGDNSCDTSELLAISPVIINHRWVEYFFTLSPTQAWSYIKLEAYYNTPANFYYNGNILLDDASSLFVVDCDSTDITPILMNREGSTLKPDTISFKRPESLTEFEQIIISNGGNIQFDPNRQFLKKQPYFTEDGKEMFQNRYLHQIAEALNTYPGVQLVIAVKGVSSTSLYNNKLQDLKQTFEYLGINKRQFRIRAYHDLDDQHDWTYKDDRGNGLLIGYQFR